MGKLNLSYFKRPTVVGNIYIYSYFERSSVAIIFFMGGINIYMCVCVCVLGSKTLGSKCIRT